MIVPASSANLGPAFDCAAVALDLRLQVNFAARADRCLQLSYQGPHPREVPTDERNLVARGARALAARIGADLPGADLEIVSPIPIGVGMGSSAAASVAGILIGARLCGMEPDPAMVLRLAQQLEGHPDNAAAALLGGLVIAAIDEESGSVLTIRRDLPEQWRFVVVVPDFRLPTAQSRQVLPSSYPRADAVYNVQRTALLVASLFSAPGELRSEFFRDRLHQPFRSALVPGLSACLAVTHPQMLGVFLSGAGSAVIALVTGGEGEVGELLVSAFRSQGVQASPLTLTVSNQGASFGTADQSGRP